MTDATTKLAEEEAELKRKFTAIDEEDRLCKKKLAEHEAEKLLVEDLTAKIQMEISFYEEISKTRKMKREEREKERTERSALFSQQASVGSRIAVLKQELDAVGQDILRDQDILRAEMDRAAASVGKSANDPSFIADPAVLRAELDALKKEKEALDLTAANNSHENSSKKAELEKALAEEKQTEANLKEELLIVTEKTSGKTRKHEEGQRLLDELNSKQGETTKQLLSIQAELDQLEADTATQRQRVTDLQDTKSKSRAIAAKHLETKCKLSVYRKAFSFVERAVKKEKRARIAERK